MSKKSIQYSQEKLEKFKTIIEDQLKQTDKELTRFLADRKSQKQHLANTNVDFNQNSKHFQQQAKNKKLINRLQHKSRELKAALRRIEDKTYGICDRTGALIREERLMARPTARFDIPHK
ncbi:TraR/DksA family transcriptional regulator [Kordia sp.]|uniref:TraR/DksA family transcriptional regulator n=1 Tax=Kordia sp. TaxID=1965332 RepID=UPI003D2B75E2